MTRVIGPLSVVAASVFAVVFTAFDDEPRVRTDPQAPMTVAYETIEPRDVTDVVVGHGVAAPRWQTTLTSEVSGRVVSVSDEFLSGNRVLEGDVLAIVDSTNYEAELVQARSDLAVARRILSEERQRADIAARDWKASGLEGDPADLVLRKPQLEEAHAAVDAAKATVRNAEYKLARTRIIAPYDGVIVHRSIGPSDFVRTGEEIGRLFDSRIFEVPVPLSMEEMDRLNPDVPAVPAVLRAQHGNAAWTGSVVRVEQAIDTRNLWRNVVIQITDTDGLLPGQFVTAEIKARTYPDVLAIPEYLPGHDGTVWFIDGDDRLRSFVPDVLFRDSDNLYVRGASEIGPLLRATIARPAYLPGVKVRPVSNPATEFRAVAEAVAFPK